jgi:hypothetical protein
MAMTAVERKAEARGTKVGNPTNLITASADRGAAIGNAANVARATRRLVDLSQ